MNRETLNPAVTLILGGARSGKSTHAEKLASNCGERVLYIATAEAKDDEMARRIAVHRAERPAGWRTVEAPHSVAAAVERTLMEISPPDALLLDCVTLLASNILLANETAPPAATESALLAELEALLTLRRERLPQTPLILVSNEVGLGIVPAYPLGRQYQDLLGRANQYLARHADRVLFMVAGLPMVVK